MSNITNTLEKSEEVAGRLKLIANANRLRILCRLVQGEISVGDIETELDIRQPTLSREIAKLRDGGIITARRQSKVVFYSLTDPNMRRLVEAICLASSGAELSAAGGLQSPSLRPARPISFNPRPKFTASNAMSAAPGSAPAA